MQIKQKEKEAVEVCYIIGEINIDSVKELKDLFKNLISANARKVLLNFQQVEYIDSTGLAALIQFSKDLKEIEGTVFLSDLSPKIKSLFAITKLDTAFKTYETEQEALKDSYGY